MIKYRKAGEMKDSGVEWIGGIPRDWEIRNLKYIGFTKSGLGNKKPKDFGHGYPFISYKNIYKNLVVEETYPDLVDSTEADRENFSVLRGDAFFTGSSETIEELGIASMCIKDISNATYNGFSIRFRPHSLSQYYPECMKYYFRSQAAREHLIRNDNSITRANLSQKLLKMLPVLLASFNQQKKIANFLDLKTTQFDSIISKKEQLIKKLEEAKKSLISEVVTGKVKIVDGKLVPRDLSEMKDSGVEWLGMIPRDWAVKKIKHIAECYPSNVDKKTMKGEKRVRLCNYRDVYYNDYITDDLAFMKATATISQIKKFTLKKGDIVLTKDSESPDDIAIASYIDGCVENLVCGYHLTLIRDIKGSIDLYVYYQLMSTGARNYFETVANGVTRYGIGIFGFVNLQVCIPNIEEQEKISKYIRSYINEQAKIIININNQIRKLKQAKQSLISEAVTGKIDLRDWKIIEGELQ
ncbi:MAG: hypothetical protein COA82_11385 [Alkaliphilus sp.]|nr:restriction endonuclease subunit S [bacterium AH-315-G05]PHS30514.1 MAG: hypothetical protein COA82_11385 [Alkaliphilus sp.]